MEVSAPKKFRLFPGIERLFPPWPRATEDQRSDRDASAPFIGDTCPISFTESPDVGCWEVPQSSLINPPSPLDWLTDPGLQLCDRREWPIVHAATEMLATQLAAPVVYYRSNDTRPHLFLGRVQVLWYSLMMLEADEGSATWLRRRNAVDSATEAFLHAWTSHITFLLAAVEDKKETVCAALPAWLRNGIKQPLGAHLVVDVPPLTAWAAASTLLAARSVWSASAAENTPLRQPSFGAMAAVAVLTQDMRSMLHMDSSVLVPSTEPLPPHTMSPAMVRAMVLVREFPGRWKANIGILGTSHQATELFQKGLCSNADEMFERYKYILLQIELLSALALRGDVACAFPHVMMQRVITHYTRLRSTFAHSGISDDVLLTCMPQVADMHRDPTDAPELDWAPTLDNVAAYTINSRGHGAVPAFLATTSAGHPYGPYYEERLPPDVHRSGVMAVQAIDAPLADDAFGYLCMIRGASAARGDTWWVRPDMYTRADTDELLMHPDALHARVLRSAHAHAMSNTSKKNAGFSNRWLLMARELSLLCGVQADGARGDLAAIICDMLQTMMFNLFGPGPIPASARACDVVDFIAPCDFMARVMNLPRMPYARVVCEDFLVPLFNTLVPGLERLGAPTLYDGFMGALGIMTRLPEAKFAPRWSGAALMIYMRYVWRRYMQWRGLVPLEAGDAVEPFFRQNPHMMQAIAWYYMHLNISAKTAYQWMETAPPAPTDSRNRYKKGRHDETDDPASRVDDADEYNGMISRRRAKPSRARVYLHRGMRTDLGHLEQRFAREHVTPTSMFGAQLQHKLTVAGADPAHELFASPQRVLDAGTGIRKNLRSLRHVALHAIYNDGRAFASLNDAIHQKGGRTGKRGGAEVAGKNRSKSRLDNAAASSSADDYDADDSSEGGELREMSKDRIARAELSLGAFILFSLPHLAPSLPGGHTNMVPLMMLGTCRPANAKLGSFRWTHPRVTDMAAAAQTIRTTVRKCNTLTAAARLSDVYSPARAIEVAQLTEQTMHAQFAGNARGLALVEMLTSMGTSAAAVKAIPVALSSLPTCAELPVLFARDVPIVLPNAEMRPDSGAEVLYFPYASMLIAARAKWYAPGLVPETPLSPFTSACWLADSLPLLKSAVPGQLSARLAEIQEAVKDAVQK